MSVRPPQINEIWRRFGGGDLTSINQAGDHFDHFDSWDLKCLPFY